MIKNDLFLRALKGETVDRPPVWMMRQAGRYLPEFHGNQKEIRFLYTLSNTRIGIRNYSATNSEIWNGCAILFSDILVIPQAMNIEVK